MVEYHDREWGKPVHDDRVLFEFLILEGAQAGLSWEIVLNKRENYRRAFERFDAAKIARYDKRKVRELLGDAGIVRNRLKIAATISNAAAFLAVQRGIRIVRPVTSGSSWAGARRKMIGRHRGRFRRARRNRMRFSKDLKARGFRFVGTTICYAFMQAIGMVNDHARDCFRYESVG